MRRNRRHLLMVALAALLAMTALVTGCAPAAAPTPTPTKPAPAAAPTTAPPTAAATKPAGTPAATPTTGAAAKPTGKPIKIGLITPLTGRVATYGAHQKAMAQLAADDVNASGGINGGPLEITLADDQADPQQAVTMVRRLANDDKVPFILGPLTTGSYEVAAPLANELKVPVATATSSKERITDQNRPWVFRFNALDATLIPKGIAGYKSLYPNVKKVVIVGDAKESVSNNIVRNVFPTALKAADLAIIDTVAFDTGTTDFSAIVTKIKELNPDGIAYISLTPETVAITKELQRQGVKVPVVATKQTWGGPEVILTAGGLEGWVASGVFDEDAQDPLSRSVVERYTKIGAADPAMVKPAYVSTWAGTYDAILAVAKAMRDAKVTPDTDLQKTREAIRDGLQNLKGLKGLMGDLNMQPNGDVTTNSMAFVAKNGKWVLVK